MKKYLILDNSGYVTGFDESESESEAQAINIPDLWVEAPLDFKITNLSLPHRTKHIWKFHFERNRWEKTEVLRVPLPNEILLDDENIQSEDEFKRFNMIIGSIE